MPDASAEPSPFQVEICSIGDELLFGRIYDTNSFWLAERLSGLGATVRRIQCLPDDDDILVDALRTALQRGAALVLTTGGLGPTVDDRTLDAVASVAGSTVVVDQHTLAMFAQRRNVPVSELPPALHKMATVVAGGIVWQNPVGWAPAVEVTVGKQRIISLPGPPREMQGMFETHLAPRLATIIGRRTKAMRVKSSLHESGVAPLIQEVMKAHPGTYLKALVSLSDPGALPVDVVAHGATEHDAEERLHAAITTLRERVIAAGGTLGE